MFRRWWKAAAVLTILPGLAAASPGVIQVTSIRSWSHPGSTRVILETTGKFEFKAQREYNPDRLFFDVLHARPWIAHHRYFTHVINDALVRRVRIAEKTPLTTRIVFDLTEPAYYKVTRLDTPNRMVIEVRPMRPITAGPKEMLAAKGTAAPKAMARVMAPAYYRRTAFVYPPVPPRPRPGAVYLASNPPTFDPLPLQTIYFADPMLQISLARPPRIRTISTPAVGMTPPVIATTGARVSPAPRLANYDAIPHPSDNAARSLTRALGLKINRIVIDAGHGGHDQGTVGPNGVLEKDVVLDVALRLARLIHARMGAEVILTRSDDSFIPLHDRTSIANDRKADLFLSIHANSSPSPTVAGTETFYLNFTNSPGALDVASRENAGSDKSVGELKDLIQSITLNDKITESQTFAQSIQTSIFSQATKSNSSARNRGVKRAPFVVLIGASMPSVLAEIGFLSNARDESNLARPEYRQKIAEALYKGMSQYCQSLSHFEVASQVDRSEKPVPTGLN